MKVKSLMDSIREYNQTNKVVVPGGRPTAAWPICMTCGREPYSVELMDVSNTRIEVRVKCAHKALSQIEEKDPSWEDYAQFDVPFGADREEHIKWAIRSTLWFDPLKPEK